MDCTSKLNQVIYSDSEILKNNHAGTSTEAIVNNVLAAHSSAMAIQYLKEMSCLGICTDGSNCASLKLFTVVIQNFYNVHGSKSKLIDLNSTPNER
jgi:hypothetical protein